MTIEWVILFSVLAICGTVIVIRKQPKPDVTGDMFIKLEMRVVDLEGNFKRIEKLGKDCESLLSQNNLVKGLRPMR